MAAGGFVSRAFESMLKECSGKKHPVLRKAIQDFLDSTKVTKKSQITGTESSLSSYASEDRGADSGSSKAGSDAEQPSIGENVTATLATAGKTLEGPEVELVLNPLRLAMETKNLKILEFALDCLHKLIEYDHLEGDPGLDGGKNAPLFTEILSMVCNSIDNYSPDSTVLQVLKVLVTAVASSNFRVHGEPLLGILRVCYNITLHSKLPVNQATSKAMLTHMLSIIFRRMETDNVSSSSNIVANNDEVFIEKSSTHLGNPAIFDPNDNRIAFGDVRNLSTFASIEELQNLAVGADIKGLEALLDKAMYTEDEKNITRGIDLQTIEICQKDVLLVFRTLCKMSMKEENDEVSIKTKLLSLELLQGLLEGVNLSFTKNFYFIDSIKAYLSYALLRAAMSQSPAIFQYATGIFSVLLLRFRENLKGEVGVFFPLIVLRSLDNLECPVHQKTSVLRMLEKVCKDPQTLVDVYVNYDCDLDAPNLFERLVSTLSKIVQASHIPDSNSAVGSLSTSIKGSSIQCLVSVLKSLVEWEKSCRESKTNMDYSPKPEEVGNEIIAIKSEDSFPDYYEKDKAETSTLEAAIAEFNRKPNNGVEYLVNNKLLENTPSSVAMFLRNTQNLDKTMIGDYLGQDEKFPFAVMHAFLDSINFKGMKFDRAIRELLQSFKLPEEVQKIDRIMEKFSERYCADNPGTFKTADAAYVLGYAVFMLNSDARNPLIWPKMSKSDFIRFNEQYKAEDCAPMEVMEEIYDAVVKDEIKMNDGIRIVNSKMKTEEGRSGLVNILNLAFPRRNSGVDLRSKNEAFIKQTQAILRKKKRGVFYKMQQIEILRPMVEAVGWSLLATFSVTMEEGDNKPRVATCMEGFHAGISITYHLEMDAMRYAFLTSLVRFTFLHAPKAMRSKNSEALRTLLLLCKTNPDALQDTWNAVLECVSRLDYIISTPSIATTVMLGSNQIAKDAVLHSLRELAGELTGHVFVSSAKLRSDTVVEFFCALCGVSVEELKQNPARVFSLQKLVEISFANMARIRMVWARIWSVVSSQLVIAGSHHEEKIAIYAVECLKQLGGKYLERDELPHFTFQNEILKPFVVLMRNSHSDSIRRLIVDGVVQIIKSKSGSLKSGWRSVFMIFTAAASDGEAIAECAFESVEQVVLEHLGPNLEDCFTDCVNSLIRFANNRSSLRISLKAITLLRICENRLAEVELQINDLPVKGALAADVAHPTDVNDKTEHYWFPMLVGLSDLTSDARPEVRSCATEVLFDLLNERGKRFSQPFWESVFSRVLFPIFDCVRYAEKQGLISSDDEWFRESSVHALQLLCNLFNTFYKEVSFMLPTLLSLLLDCAKKADQTAVSIAMGALIHLIEVGGHQFAQSDWDTLLKSIRDAAYSTQPLELLNPSADSLGRVSSGPTTLDGSEGPPSPSRNSPKSADGGQTAGQKLLDNLLLRSFTSKSKGGYSSDVSAPSSPMKAAEGAVQGQDRDGEENLRWATIRGKCITQLLLLEAIKIIQKKFWANLSDMQKTSVMDILLSVLEFAASYNSYSNLKARMRMHHPSPHRPPANILRQELEGTSIYLEVLQKTASRVGDEEEKVNSISRVAEEKLVAFCSQVLREASDAQSSMESATDMDMYMVIELRSPLIVEVLRGMRSMNSQTFKRHLRDFYPLLTKLICCEQMDIKGALADLFKVQLKALLP